MRNVSILLLLMLLITTILTGCTAEKRRLIDVCRTHDDQFSIRFDNGDFVRVTNPHIADDYLHRYTKLDMGERMYALVQAKRTPCPIQSASR